MAKGKRGLDKRHRDKSGRIKRKHGNTRVGALRKNSLQRPPQGHDAENTA